VGLVGGAAASRLEAYLARLDHLHHRDLPTPLEHGASEQADQFLATAAVDQQTGALWVCYYDTQGDPQRRHARFVCQLSTDHAHSWRQIAAADKPSDEATTFASQFGYGDYESVVAADGQAHPVWTDGRSRSLQEEIFTTTLRERR